MRMYQQITRKEAIERFGATYVWRLEASMQVFFGQRSEPVYMVQFFPDKTAVLQLFSENTYKRFPRGWNPLYCMQQAVALVAKMGLDVQFDLPNKALGVHNPKTRCFVTRRWNNQTNKTLAQVTKDAIVTALLAERCPHTSVFG